MSFLKVLAWNVQGLRNWKLEDDDFLAELKSDDILFLLDSYV